MSNEIHVISPYLYHGVWVFDDPDVGLRREALVAGTDDMIECAVKIHGIKKPESGFTLIFSANSFPTAQIRLDYVSGEADSGTYYRWAEQDIIGWLCPALAKYFSNTPMELYVQVRGKDN